MKKSKEQGNKNAAIIFAEKKIKKVDYPYSAVLYFKVIMVWKAGASSL